MIAWVYGSGFPKSRNVALDMDKMEGHGNRGHRIAVANRYHPDGTLEPNGEQLAAYEPKSTNGCQWAGWGTALKPALEPITVARKPPIGTVADNVLAHGTGALNIDGCRIGGIDTRKKTGGAPAGSGWGTKPGAVAGSELGRFAANLIHDGSEEVVGLFPTNAGGGHWPKIKVTGYGEFGGGKSKYLGQGGKDGSGSAARFFYCAKASKADRDEGCEEMEERKAGMSNGAQLHGEGYDKGQDIGLNRVISRRNHHPTVKPTDLMRYLCRLVTPTSGTVLDPFMGSGSTGKAAVMEGFNFIGIESEAEYIKIAEARIGHAEKQKAETLL